MASTFRYLQDKTSRPMDWALLLWIFAGCGLELPSKPPDLLHKFNVLEVGRGPAHLLTTDFNMDGNADLVSANAKNSTLSVMLGKGEIGRAHV